MPFIVGVLTLIAVATYTVFTFFIMRAAVEQAEAAQKPCLVLRAEPRDGEDAILDAGGIVGAMKLVQRAGNVAVWNIGKGPALNARYELRPLDEGMPAHPTGYLHNVAAAEEVVMPVPYGLLSAHQYEFLATYESLSGQAYRTKIRLEDCVPTQSMFQAVKSARR